MCCFPRRRGRASACSRRKEQDHGIASAFDQRLLDACKPTLEQRKPVNLKFAVRNIHRTVGAMLSGEVTRRFGENGLPSGTIKIRFSGTAGQSFGCFLVDGMEFTLSGDANDYVGKAMSGGQLAIHPPEGSTYDADTNVLIGNVALYGATGGRAFFNGVAGERFCVRNSGATAVVEGIGDHGCEYMTGGVAIVLGKTGRNFGRA